MHEKDNIRLLGVGDGEMGELAEILMSKRKEHFEMVVYRKAAPKEERRKEEKEKEAGRRIVAAESSHRPSASETVELLDDDDDIVETQNCDGTIRKKCRIVEQKTEMDLFRMYIKEAKIALVKLEKDRLSFECDRFAVETEDREKKQLWMSTKTS